MAPFLCPKVLFLFDLLITFDLFLEEFKGDLPLPIDVSREPWLMTVDAFLNDGSPFTVDENFLRKAFIYFEFSKSSFAVSFDFFIELLFALFNTEVRLVGVFSLIFLLRNLLSFLLENDKRLPCKLDLSFDTDSRVGPRNFDVWKDGAGPFEA